MKLEKCQSCEFNTCVHKKVLLRERKRHTARRVVSTPSVVLTGYPPSWPGWGGTLPGYPPVLTWPGGVPIWVPPRPGYPPGQGTPHPDLAGGVPYLGPPSQGPMGVPPQPGYHLLLGQGTPPARVPPHQGTPPTRVPTPCLDLAGYPPLAAPWHSGKCCKALWDMGTPPRCGQTENITFPILRMRAVINKYTFIISKSFQISTGMPYLQQEVFKLLKQMRHGTCWRAK